MTVAEQNQTEISGQGLDLLLIGTLFSMAQPLSTFSPYTTIYQRKIPFSFKSVVLHDTD